MERITKELHTEFYDYYGETVDDLPDGKGHMDYLGDDYFYTYDGDHASAPGLFELAENNVNCRCELLFS